MGDTTTNIDYKCYFSFSIVHLMGDTTTNVD